MVCIFLIFNLQWMDIDIQDREAPELREMSRHPDVFPLQDQACPEAVTNSAGSNPELLHTAFCRYSFQENEVLPFISLIVDRIAWNMRTAELGFSHCCWQCHLTSVSPCVKRTWYDIPHPQHTHKDKIKRAIWMQ